MKGLNALQLHFPWLARPHGNINAGFHTGLSLFRLAFHHINNAEIWHIVNGRSNVIYTAWCFYL